MAFAGGLQPGKGFGGPWDAAAGREIDGEIHQLLPGSDDAIRVAAEFVRHVKAFRIDAEDHRRGGRSVVLDELAEVECVGLHGECAKPGPAAIGFTQTDGVPKGIGRLVKKDNIIGKVQVAVMVDPFRANTARAGEERSREGRLRV